MAQTGVLDVDHADDTNRVVPSEHRRSGSIVIAIGVAGCAIWFGWRVATLDLHPVPVVFLLAEIVGAAGAVVVGVALSKATEPRNVYAGSRSRDCYWYAHAVADIVGRTRSADLHRDVRTAVRAAPRWRPRDAADAAIAAVLAEGPRRLTLVVTIALGLLLGVSPFPVPPWWALAGAVVGYGALTSAHVVLGRRRIKFGDRRRWSYGAIGEIVSRDDVAGHAPRTWIGAVAVAVALSVTVALRGMSDRWTHGLPAMDYEHRVVAILVALGLVVGALLTIVTLPPPSPADVHLFSRRLDEATTRQTLLAAAVCVALVGLVAGVVPQGDDAGEGPSPARIADDEVVGGAEGGDG